MPAQLSQRIVKKITLSPSLGNHSPTQGTPTPRDRPSASGTLIQSPSPPSSVKGSVIPPSFSLSEFSFLSPALYRSQRLSSRIHSFAVIIGQGEAETPSHDDSTGLQPTTTHPSASQPHIVHRISPISQVPPTVTNIPHDADNKDTNILPTRWSRS
jgi:hypothetical protein